MGDDPVQSDKTLRRARERFRDLLSSRTTERDWQQFFAENPCVFARSLPLRLSEREIIPVARPGRSDPDFIFYQRSGSLLSAYGVIEIKQPHTRVLTQPRRDIVILSREADTAIRQSQRYAQSLILPEQSVILGSAMHLFVIMGLSSELLQMFAADLSRSRLASLVPLGCQIVPYDELLRRFEDTVPEQLTVLVPSLSTIESDSTEIAFLRACEEFFGESADSGSGRSLVLKRANELAFRAARLFARSGVPPDAIDPEGIAHEAILELRQTHTHLTSPSAWLRRLIFRRVREAVRANRMHVPTADLDELDTILQASSAAEPFSLAVASEFRSDLAYRALPALPFELRVPVVLKMIDGMSVREISDALNVPVNVVQSRLKQATRFLKGALSVHR